MGNTEYASTGSTVPIAIKRMRDRLAQEAKTRREADEAREYGKQRQSEADEAFAAANELDPRHRETTTTRPVLTPQGVAVIAVIVTGITKGVISGYLSHRDNRK